MFSNEEEKKMMMLLNRIYQGDALNILRTWPSEFIDCCVTSPPYWQCRDYGLEGQYGLEKTPTEYVSKLVEVFREVRRTLKKSGTFWLNLGDVYNGRKVGNTNGIYADGMKDISKVYAPNDSFTKPLIRGLKIKDLIGIPWTMAFALREDGWYLRSDIIWYKPQVMPESVKDRPTKSHEYIFLFSKSSKYYYDFESIREPCLSGPSDIKKMEEKRARIGGKTLGHECSLSKASARTKVGSLRSVGKPGGRNKRDVWIVASASYHGEHFATFPEKLITPCVIAGCPEKGLVLDPFMGSGTTALVALKLSRNFIGIELNPSYIKMGEKRIENERKQLKFI